MNKYIDAEALKKEIAKAPVWTALTITEKIENAPSIDIVFCKECKWAKANGTYQWCGRLDSTARITADDFCSYGCREEE